METRLARRSHVLMISSLFACAAAFGAEPKEAYSALRSVRPDGKAFAISELVLERDALRFHFVSGVFQFLTSVEGRTLGGVFVGTGIFELTPATQVERGHLAFVTGSKTLATLKDSFEAVVLLFSDGTQGEIENHGRPASPLPRAADVYDRFFKAQRKEIKRNLQIRLLADLFQGPDPSSGVFLAYFVGKEYPPAVAAYDPGGLDWLLGAQIAGETTALHVFDDRSGGLWYSSGPRKNAEVGTSRSGRATARALHYAIDTTIRKNDQIAGTTTVRFLPLADNLRVLPIRLLPTLRLKEVAVSSGDSGPWNPAGFVQEDEKEDADAAILFLSPMPRSGARLRISYAGKGVLEEASDGTYYVQARDTWYPNLGTFSELSSFELIYRIPKDFMIVSVGSPVEEHAEGDQKVSVWKQERPIRVAGFNYGKFRKVERADKDTGILMDIYASETRGRSDVLEDAAMADSFNTARVGTARFGPLPETRISITQQGQYSFGQSWPSLIYLPSSVAGDTPNRRSVMTRDLADFVDRVGSHEFAHQWWGHLVGWNGYRDQWLSEGFAEFTSALVVEQLGGPKGYNEFWERARGRILAKPTRAFVANNEAGPIAEGWRLATWRNRSAAQAMIYTKGAYVLHMLRMMMRDLKSPRPDEAFMDTLKDFAKSFADKNPSTRDFQTVVERHMTPAMNLAGNGKMDWFFQQWVWGTEIPRYSQKIALSKAGEGQYRLTGSVTQEEVPSDFRALVHIYVSFAKGETAHLGAIALVGATTRPLDATIPLSKEPKQVVVNALHDVLSRD